MLSFITLQYQMKRITKEQVKQYAVAGWIAMKHAVEITGE